MIADAIPDSYVFHDAVLSPCHDYLLKALKTQLAVHFPRPGDTRIFDLGCGNGSVADNLSRDGYHVTGVDPSTDGIGFAHKNYPHLSLHLGSAYDNLCQTYGKFDAVISLEVVEHLYNPRQYAKTIATLVKPDGVAIISTPYHGYLKNLALALTGKMDSHFTALWDHGHIKFWSRKTLEQLLREAGFTRINFVRVGRIPPLAKSMIAIASFDPQ